MRSKIGECKAIDRWNYAHVGGQGQIFRDCSEGELYKYMFIRGARIINFTKSNFYIEKYQVWFINSLEIITSVNVE
jgi:hypothetical protein